MITRDPFAANAPWRHKKSGRTIRIVKPWPGGWFTIYDHNSPSRRRYRNISMLGLKQKYEPIESAP